MRAEAEDKQSRSSPESKEIVRQINRQIVRYIDKNIRDSKIANEK